MSLEDEAKQFMQDKQGAVSQFKMALAESISPIIQFVEDNVYDCREREIAMERLQDFGFWLNYAVDTHGVKEVILSTEDV